MQTNKSKILGVLFDVSLRHASDGIRVLDHVKNGLADYVREEFDHDDVFYLYHPHVTEVLNRAGEQTAVIQNYECDGFKIKLLQHAFLQTLYVIAAEEGERVFLYVTDRNSDVQALQGALDTKLNSIHGPLCRFFVLGIGSGYDRSKYESLPVNLIHVENPQDIRAKLKEAGIFEEKNEVFRDSKDETSITTE